MDEKQIFAEYQKTIQQFKSKKDPSMGDTRAYLAALVDLNILERGAKNRSDMLFSLEKSLRHIKSVDIHKDYKNTIKSWQENDRSALKNYLNKIHGKQTQIIKKSSKNGFKAISLFTGSCGLDLGFEYAGFKICLGLDIDPGSKELVELNRANIPFLFGDIKDITTNQILGNAGMKKGEIDVLLGGPPCQPFSPAGNQNSLYDPRSRALIEYIRVIEEAQPKFFVMEEVPGLLTASIKHVPLIERQKRRLSREEKKGSAWNLILKELKKTKYKIIYSELNAADYGTPQIRKRIIAMGVRPDYKVKPALPEPTHKKPGKPSLTPLKPWVPLLDAILGVEPGQYNSLGPKYKEYMPYVPPGGNWRQIPDDLKKEAMNSAYFSGGGKMGFYRRLTWFEPAPTLVTSPSMKATMMIHPWEDRAISVNEYKLIQGFPIDWKVPKSLGVQYKKLGEAVPPILANAVALKVRELLSEVKNQ